MKRNETALIADSKKRQLTAKGYKFLEKMRETAAAQRGLTRYHKEMKEINSALQVLILDLIIDKRMNEEQIKEVISNSLNKFKIS